MKIALIQHDIVWQDHAINLLRLERLLPEKVDLIVLPEMFSCGFSVDPKLVALAEGGLVLQWMKDQSARLNAVVAGSVPVKKEIGGYANRLYWVKPDGSCDTYDKRHLFRMGGEADTYSAGNRRVIACVGEWYCLLQICYDLRFPVFSRNRNDYHLAVYVANWPLVRQKVWRALLIARAIENQCFVLGVNRIGEGDGLVYPGGTMVIDPKGDVLAEAKPMSEEVLLVELEMEVLQRFRQGFPVWRDADDFMLKEV